MPIAIDIHGLLVHGHRGYLLLPDMDTSWPLPDYEQTVKIR